jgi:hypothetical protein
VLIRSAFPGRLDGITLFRFFPAAKGIAETFPSIETTVDAFAVAGFEVEALQSVPQITATNRRARCERVRLRADTTLAALSNDEFARGMEALERAAVEENASVPVIDWLDLLVLASRPGACPAFRHRVSGAAASCSRLGRTRSGGPSCWAGRAGVGHIRWSPSAATSRAARTITMRTVSAHRRRSAVRRRPALS